MLRSEKMQKNISVYPEPAIETCRNFSTRLNLIECVQDIVKRYTLSAILATLTNTSKINGCFTERIQYRSTTMKRSISDKTIGICSMIVLALTSMLLFPYHPPYIHCKTNSSL